MADVNSLFTSVAHILKHIKEVNESVISTSDTAFGDINQYFTETGTELPAHLLRALQMQDILRQQLNGSTEAINLINQSIAQYQMALKADSGLLEESLAKLDTKLQHTLTEAKAKKEAFAGETDNEDGNDVEFF
jgi:hypothetical protein